MTEVLQEFATFLHMGSRLDLKDYALTQILGLTGSEEGVKLIQSSDVILTNLLMLLDDTHTTVSKDACLILVNISANKEGATKLVRLEITKAWESKLVRQPDPLIQTLVRCILNPACHFADIACMTLSNCSRHKELVEDIIESIDSPETYRRLLAAFTAVKYNEKGATLDYLGPIFSNLSQSPTMRRVIMDATNTYMQRLLAFTEHPAVTRRGGVVATLKNCCFDTQYHEWLLGDEVDILPRLLLPLAGPEEFDDEDNEKLPPDLQYLADDKKREEDPDIRCMLLEAINQLCALKKNRELIREKNAYVILRELHKWEKCPEALTACENLVDILIRTEEEIAADDLKALEIPDEMQAKIDKLSV